MYIDKKYWKEGFKKLYVWYFKVFSDFFEII